MITLTYLLYFFLFLLLFILTCNVTMAGIIYKFKLYWEQQESRGPFDCWPNEHKIPWIQKEHYRYTFVKEKKNKRS